MAETPTTETLPRWTWTADEVAAVLGVSGDCVNNLHRLGQLVGVKVGRSLRWRPADVRAYVERAGRDDPRPATDLRYPADPGGRAAADGPESGGAGEHGHDPANYHQVDDADLLAGVERLSAARAG